MSSFSTNYIQELIDTLRIFPHKQFEKMISTLIEAYKMNHTIFVMGNGGSGATASHWACDINKGCSFVRDKKFRMMCLNDNVATILAYANDVSYDDVFVEQLKNFFNSGDIVIGISGSGNSTNVLKAIQYANKHGGITIGLCGFNGGKLHKFVDIPLLAKIHDMQKVEDMHTIITHMAMQRVCQLLDNYQPVELIHEATA